jgi:hypothetical protein
VLIDRESFPPVVNLVVAVKELTLQLGEHAVMLALFASSIPYVQKATASV